ncbi:MAG TPA: heme-binding protein [Spongiibacteraceae bacterium]|nr:heme-binding protein [Spongiibacteraceae bacterium]
MSHTHSQPVVSHRAAIALVQAALAKAEALGLAVAIAVVDRNGLLRGALTMDAAPLIAEQMCRAKANAALLGLASEQLANMLKDQLPQLVSFASWPGVSIMGGGLPVIIDGQVVGAIGVGGASTEQDIAIAEAALASLSQ